MIAPDTLPAWLWVPAAIFLWALFFAPFVWALIHAPVDPDPRLSRLDVLDGVGSHTG